MSLVPGSPQAGHGQSPEARSARHRAERSARSGRLARAIIPAFLAIAVVVAVAVLSSPLVPARSSGRAGGATTSLASSPGTTISASASTAPTATTATTGPAAPKAAGSALLVVTQDGKMALAALVYAGPKGAVVLGVPGATILRSGGGFVVLAQAFSASDPSTLAGPVAEAFSVPQSATAVADWSGLKGTIAALAVDSTVPDQLDSRGADAGAVAALLAAGLRGGSGGQGAAGSWWQAAPLTGQVKAFRATIAAEIAAGGTSPWTGQALAGQMVEYGDGGSYLEPDIQEAKALLQATGAAAGPAAGPAGGAPAQPAPGASAGN